MPAFKKEFVQNSFYRIDENIRMIGICLVKLTDEQIWAKPNSVSNSIANQILHLCGNIRQYVITGLGGASDTRNRDLEFSQTRNYTKSGLLLILEHTIEESKSVILASSDDNWLAIKNIQGFQLSGIGLVFHAVEHLSYHTGQIALISKLLLEQPLGFYDGFDLNSTNG
jgi:uncharacterized damage-inducible protein DinB